MYYLPNVGNEFMLVRNFNRSFSAIRVEQFGKPKIAPINALEFPRASIFHFLPNGTDCLGPEQSLPYLAKAEKLMYARHHVKYRENTVGRPIAIPRQDLNPKLLAYHRANRKIRQLKDDKIIDQDPRTLLIENYANLPYMFRYQQTVMSWYERYQNIYSVVWDQVAQDVKRFDRNNYIIVDLPEVMPSIVDLKRAEVKRDNNTLKNIRDDMQLLFLELWTWLGEHRERSLMDALGTNQLIEVNIILKAGSRFTNLNLGEINYWRTGVAGMSKTGNESYDGDVQRMPDSMEQIRFIEETLGLEWFNAADPIGNESADNKIKGLLSSRQAQYRLYMTCVRLLTEAQQGDMIDSVTEALAKNAEIESEAAEAAVTEEDRRQIAVVLGRAPSEEEETFNEETLKEDLKAYDDVELDESKEFTVAREPEVTKTAEQLAIDAFRPLSYEECVDKACQQYVDSGTMSVKAYETFKELSQRYKTIKNPHGTGTLAENLEITQEEAKLEEEVLVDDVFIVDKSITKTSTAKLDRKYVEEVMPKDMNATIMALQRAGHPVLNYEVERIVDAANDMELHTIEVSTVKGSPRTPLRLLMPKVNRYGMFKSNNVQYTMRRQRVDLPIRKISPSEVALTSFYGKHFVARSEKVVNNYGGWLVNNIRARGEDQSDVTVTGMRYGNVFDRTVQTPRDYSAVSMSISEVTIDRVNFYFDYQRIDKNFPTEVVVELTKEQLLPVGKKGSVYYGMDKSSMIYRQTPNGLDAVGTLAEMMQLDRTKEPFEVATLTVSDKEIPLGLVFAYYDGLKGTLDQFKIPYRIVDPGERIPLNPDEFALKLADCKIIISPNTRKQALIINGLRSYAKLTAPFTLKDMNGRSVYQVLIAKDKMKPYYLQELVNMDDLFIDPITLRILKGMKEPETWKGLLIRSVELISYDQHSEEIDIEEQHIFGHQRIVGAMYTELARAVREYRSKPANGKKRIDVNVRAAWDRIHEDGSVAPVSDCNPLHFVKQQAVITAGGTGGRSRRSMTKPTRRFGEKSLGIISGDGVDNGDAGMTEFLAANAQLGTIDGLVKKNIDRSNLDISMYMSSVFMTAPELYYDDGKRQVFYGIQIGSTTSAKGYIRPGVLTGAETMIAHITSPTQANVAIDNGRVTAMDDATITVTYGNGQKQYVESYPVGRVFGSHEGHTYPHDLITKFKVGDKVSKGDVLSYNTKFFVENPFNPKQVDWMQGTISPIAFMEGEFTLEDTNLLGPELSDSLSTEGTAIRNITTEFNQELHNLGKVGDEVDSDTIIALLEDRVSTTNDVFREDSVNTLRALSSHAPKAKYTGRIDKMEVFYNGELEDMSDSLRKLVQLSDRIRKKAAGSDSSQAVTGRVNGTMRVDGNPVELNTAVIRVYISYWSKAIGGSKVVFANQMKSTIREVSPVSIKTELGYTLGGVFGKVSNDNRIVNSIYRQCAGNTVSRLVAEDTLKIIRGQK